MDDNDLIRRGDALAAVQLGDTVTKMQARIRAIPSVDADPVCTDCGGTGITYQTERRCACQPALTPASDGRAEAMLAEAVKALEVVKADCVGRMPLSRDGRTVPIGDGAWGTLCKTLAKIKEAKNGNGV